MKNPASKFDINDNYSYFMKLELPEPVDKIIDFFGHKKFPKRDFRLAGNELEFITACQKLDVAALNSVFAKKVNPFAVDQHGMNGLMYVLQGPDAEMCKALIEYSQAYQQTHRIAGPSLVNRPIMNEANARRSALSVVTRMITDEKDKRFAKVVECAHLLLQAGANIHAGYGSHTPLTSAIMASPVLCQIFIDHGADVHHVSKIPHEMGMTPLMMAAKDGSAGVTTVLLKNGANPNIANKLGETPLMMSAHHDNGDAAQALLAQGVDIDAINDEGQTPLMRAAQRGAFEVVQVLLLNGAKLELADASGKTARDYAEKCRINSHDEVNVIFKSHALRTHAHDLILEWEKKMPAPSMR